MIYDDQTEWPLLSVFIVNDQSKELCRSHEPFWLKEVGLTKKYI